jgi:hypothetical protein
MPYRRCLSCFLIALASTVPTNAQAQAEDVGINGHDAEPAVLEMAADLGVGWIRVDANWFQMEPRPGEFRWLLDDAVSGATARDVRVYITLAYTADWVPRVERARSDSYVGNDEPLGSAEWQAFVTEAVRHYRALGVTHFGIWNEPNLDHFFEGTVDAYIDKILIPGADAVHDACSDCVVLGPDLAHVGDYHQYLAPILRRAGDRIDIVAHHIYQGFPELGVSIFDGDNFVQALEMRRFAFTRPALKELLDAQGWSGEVWITETGYRASSIGDPGDEGDQATYVRLVLEEQLTRDWWTNTFFYEALDCGIDIAGCDIDGFGLTRPAHSRPRAFPTDFRTKPAYEELRDYIAAHPVIGSDGEDPPPPPPPPAEGDAAPPPAGSDGGAPASDGSVGGEDPAVHADAGTTPEPTPPGDGEPPMSLGSTEPASGGCSASGTRGAWVFALIPLLGALCRRRRRP